MGKDPFLEYFQRNLRDSIHNLVVNTWNHDEFIIDIENRDIAGKFDGFIDISIKNKNIENAVLAIEIEHKSSYENAKRNITKMKTWAHNSNFRKCSYLHIFNEECNFSEDSISKLVGYAKEHEKMGHGFYYDFIFYKIDDRRQTRSLAEELVNLMDFRTRLWMLLELSSLV